MLFLAMLMMAPSAELVPRPPPPRAVKAEDRYSTIAFDVGP